MTSELLPCPFCGGTQVDTYFVRDGRRVSCRCGASIVAFHGPSTMPSAEDRVRTAWNTRAKADQIMGVEGAEITEAVHTWVRDDLPLGAQMTAGFHIQKLIARLQALKGPTHDQ